MPAASAIATVGAAVIGGVASNRAASKGADAAKDAAEIQAQAQNRAVDLQERIYDQNREDAAPYRAVGVPALNRLASSLGIVPAQPVGDRTVQPVSVQPVEDYRTAVLNAGGNEQMVEAILPQNREIFLKYSPERRRQALETMDWRSIGVDPTLGPVKRVDTTPAPEFVDVQTMTPAGPDPLEASQEQLNRLAAGFETSPGYQFRLKEGENALARAQGARGKLFSGDAIKEAMQFGQGLASDEYNTYMSRAVSQFGDYNNRLAALAGVGQSATQAGMAAGQNFANSAASILNSGANNQANALLAGGAIQAGNIANIGRGFQDAANNYMFYNALQQQPNSFAPMAPPQTGSTITGTAGFPSNYSASVGRFGSV